MVRSVDDAAELLVDHLDEADRRHRRQFARAFDEVDGRDLDLVAALLSSPPAVRAELADLGELAVDDRLVALVAEDRRRAAARLTSDGDEELLTKKPSLTV